jgi:aspartyl-tRNA synthetase
MYRTHTCGELRLQHKDEDVSLCGWVQGIRDKGSLLWIDLRDRYGITQVTIETENIPAALVEQARGLGREYVICVKGKVAERYSRTDKIATGDIEIIPDKIEILNSALTPPFTIEDNTDGGDELRMKYRYLDLRRNEVRSKLQLRHRVSSETRKYLDAQNFIEVETPVLIKSTPEGARDFIVPSRINKGQFYALPQSPQTFKQILMVAGFDRYYQIVKCFRDEDLRADRQPEFTQIDCEMSFVEQEDILQMFEGMTKHLFKYVKDVEFEKLPRITWHEAMRDYGIDKPDTRFGMKFNYLSSLVKNKGFKVFDDAEDVIGICVPGAAGYSRKQIDELTEWAKDPQRGMGGLIYMKVENGTFKSSVDKFYGAEELRQWAALCGATDGDLVLIFSGKTRKVQKALGELRLLMGERLGLRDKNKYAPLWVVDFPLLEFNEEDGRFYAMHHPFTAPKPEDIHLLDTDPGSVRANAYDMVINGVEVGGGSIRIHDKNLQAKMFSMLGLSKEQAQEQFGFLMNAFEYGAPPHGGIAFGFDRLCSLFGGSETIRDYIAFPKNNSGRDMMIDAPSGVDSKQLDELGLKVSER